jgi:sugar phosphate isomerase/epimerase
LAALLDVARRTGWDAVELRRLDFDRGGAAGTSEAEVLDLVRNSGLAVSAVGVTSGWMFADGSQLQELLVTFEASCAAAAALGSTIVMSAVDKQTGDVDGAVASVRRVGEIAARYGVRVALEFNSQAAQFNTLESVRDLLAAAAHPAFGLLLDTYHLHRSGRGGDFADVRPEEIVYVQYSDVPRTGLQPGYALDRLPPGDGAVDFSAIFARLDEYGYAGPLSYEAPNPAAWARDPVDVAREALQATRTVLATALQSSASI